MLFLAIHTHDADKCPANNPDRIKQFQKALSEEEAKKNECRLIEIFVAPAEHVAYIIIETDEHECMMRFLRPLLKLGETRITPVERWKNVAEQLQRFTAASNTK